MRVRRWLYGAIAASFMGIGTAVVLGAGGSKPTGSESEEWVNIPAQSLLVDAGSPLDFSALLSGEPAGMQGPLVLTAMGKLAFGGTGPEPRFNCAMLAGGPDRNGDYPTHKQADRLVEQLRRHGYTLVRMHNTDWRLMQKAHATLEIDPEQLDRYFYLLAALKRAGIYWMVDVLSTGSTDLAGPNVPTPSPVDSVRVRIDFDPAARVLWQRFVDRVFAAPNPYTGRSTLTDPALAFVIGANESSMGFGARVDHPFPQGLDTHFDAWVRQHYPTSEALATALPDMTAAERGGAPIALPAGWGDRGPRMSAFLHFVAVIEQDGYRWMESELRARGFAGQLLGFQDWYPAGNNETRAALPIIDAHIYVGGVASFASGTILRLPNVTDPDGLGPWLLAASAQWLDRPMVLSEYGQPYPNASRTESGLLIPALAAFQGWRTICRTAFQPVQEAVPVANGAKGLRPYEIGLDPAERAAETLATLLFFRGDVRPAISTVAVPFGEKEFAQPGSVVLPIEYRRAALLTRFGLIAPGKVGSLPAGSRIVLAGATSFATSEKVTARLTNLIHSGPANQLVNDLRRDGTLPPGNRTDPARGIFQSQTGELTLDQPAGRITIVTTRTEAVSTTGPATDITLGRLAIHLLNTNALVAASALDGKPLAASRRVLLMLASDVRNSNMGLTRLGKSWRVDDWGHMPLRMRRVVVDATLATDARGPTRLTVLSLRGTPQATLPITLDKGIAHLHLDTVAVPGSPTTWFLLEIGPPRQHVTIG